MTRLAWIGCAVSACLAIIVTAMLLVPMPDGKPLPVPYLDKAVHAGLFCGVALPAMLTAPRRWHGVVWLVVLGYSGVTELVQPYFGRGAEWGDLAANAAGAGVAVLVARGVRGAQGPAGQSGPGGKPTR